MIVDFDDFCEHDHRLDLLHQLKEANPAFRCTLFAIPGLGTRTFWESVPDWCELAIHGWLHPHPREAEWWGYDHAWMVLHRALDRGPFVKGFKAPGWQISDGTYQACMDAGFWVADHYENDRRRPDGVTAHVISETASHGADPDHWHGHIPNVCGNGIEETFSALLDRVLAADSFELISESVTTCRRLVAV